MGRAAGGPRAGRACYGICASVDVGGRCRIVHCARETFWSGRAAAACGPAPRPPPAQDMVDCRCAIWHWPSQFRAHAGNRRELGTRCRDVGRLQWARHGSSLRYGVQLVSAGSVCVTGASGGGFDDVGDGPGFVSRRCGLRRGAGVCAATRIAGILAGAWRVCLRAGRWLGVGTDRRCLGVCWHGQALLCLAAPS